MKPSSISELVAEAERRLGLSFEGSRRATMLAALELPRSGSGPLPDAEDRIGWLADRLTVAESFFFRDPRQLSFLADHLVPDVLERRGRGHSLRVWSAGCAGGEEPYTLAMVLADLGLRGASIVGTDVAPGALRRAEAGLYSPWALRGVHEDQQRRWFHPMGRQYQVDADIRAAVRFQHLNLIQPSRPTPRDCDIVLCRNVLVYLTADGLDQAVRTLLGALAPGGWLLTAATDPPLDTPFLERVRTPMGVAYRRRPPDTPPASTAGHGRPRTAPSAVQPATKPARRHTTPAPPTRHRTASELALGAHARSLTTEARALGDAGAIPEALALLAAAVEGDPLNAGLRHLQAVLHLANGAAAAAAAAGTAAVYLQPDLAVAHLVLAHARLAAGEQALAGRSFSIALRLLEAMPADAPVPFGDGQLAGTLARSARRQARAR